MFPRYAVKYLMFEDNDSKRFSLYLVGAHVSSSLLLVFVLLILLVLVLLFFLFLGFVVLAADVEKLLHLQHVTGT